MSSLPGYKLEDYLAWQWDLIVDGDTGANKSMEIAESLGIPSRRICITLEQFQPLLALYEPYRDYIEERLTDFDEGTMSWRDYAGWAFGDVPPSVDEEAGNIRVSLKVEPSEAKHD